MSHQTKRILLLEPDSVLAGSLTAGLINAGYDVQHVYSAQAAVSSADRLKPDLVFCELQLTAHSGIEFLYEFRSYSDWSVIPVVIYSSVPPVEFNASRNGLTYDLKISGYLYKPDTTLAEVIDWANKLT
jgi:CheY-like chemotaxis protein